MSSNLWAWNSDEASTVNASAFAACADAIASPISPADAARWIDSSTRRERAVFANASASVDRWVIEMRRRGVIAGLVALLVAPEHPAAQQPSGKIPRIGILTLANNERTRFIDAFREGLRDLGYVEGRNIILEFRFAGGDRAQGRRLAEELVAAPVDVIVTERFTRDAAAVTERIPIVATALPDPVGLGFAVSLARPGRNITGFTMMQAELNGKRLELLRIAFPQITTIAALVNPNPSSAPGRKFAFEQFEQIETAARSMGLGNVQGVEAESAAALRALRPAIFSGASGVVVVPDGLFYNFRRDVVVLVNEAKLPAIYPEREYADDGGLMAYGPNLPDNFRRAADYVDRILKGTKPGDLRSSSRSSSISLST
jgi:putative ABC transport system substrate-binding protein